LTAVLAAHLKMTIVRYDADREIAVDVPSFEHGWVLPPRTRLAAPARCASTGVRGATRYFRTRVAVGTV